MLLLSRAFTVKAVSDFHTAMLVRKLGVHWRLIGDTARKGDQVPRRLFQTIWDHAQYIELGVRRRKRRKFDVMVFFYQSSHYVRWSPTVLEMADHLPALRKR